MILKEIGVGGLFETVVLILRQEFLGYPALHPQRLAAVLIDLLLMYIMDSGRIKKITTSIYIGGDYDIAAEGGSNISFLPKNLPVSPHIKQKWAQ